MSRKIINNFGEGMVGDIYGGGVGEFSVSKHFDILTYPNRLQPLRGMTADTAVNSLIGNIWAATDGALYAVGSHDGTSNTSQLWTRAVDYTATQWLSTGVNNFANEAISYPLLLDFPECGSVKTIVWSSASSLFASDPSGAVAMTGQAISFGTIGQGFVHPINKTLYIPYQSPSAAASYIASQPPGQATPWTGYSATALTLPKRYRCYCLCDYGNYLACPGTTVYGSAADASVVFLWDTTSSTWNEQIKWGGQLQVLNNIGGTLVGISTSSFNYVGAVADAQSLIIKGYNGGGEPFNIAELFAQHLASSSGPSVTINPNVNFVRNNRLYFSANIVPNDGISNSYYGLWSVGKNKRGRWVVNLERVATNGNTETGVLAAAISGDFVSMLHTAIGTLTVSIGSANPPTTSSTSYGATSVHETVVNPEMSPEEKVRFKTLSAVSVSCLPLTTGQQIKMYYRVDSQSNSLSGILGAGWTLIFTKTASSPDTNVTNYESAKDATGSNFSDGFNYEFRLESTGGAVPIAYTYNTQPTATNI